MTKDEYYSLNLKNAEETASLIKDTLSNVKNDYNKKIRDVENKLQIPGLVGYDPDENKYQSLAEFLKYFYEHTE